MKKFGFSKILKNGQIGMRFCQQVLEKDQEVVQKPQVKDKKVYSAERIQILDKKYLEFEKKMEEKYGKKEFGFFTKTEISESSKTTNIAMAVLLASIIAGSVYFYVYQSKKYVNFRKIKKSRFYKFQQIIIPSIYIPSRIVV